MSRSTVPVHFDDAFTMSPSLKYLIVLSIAARVLARAYVSLTHICGEVMAGLGILLGCSGQGLGRRTIGT